MKNINKDDNYYMILISFGGFEFKKATPCFKADGTFDYFSVESLGVCSVLKTQVEGIYKDSTSENFIYSEDALMELYDALDNFHYPLNLDAPQLQKFPSTDKDKIVLKQWGNDYVITPVPLGNARVHLPDTRQGQSVVMGDGERYYYILTRKENQTNE